MQGNLNGQRYRDEILRPHAVPMLRRIGQGAVYQDDNARPHRAGLVDDFLVRSGVVRMDWPACSPNLNPIEFFWDHLERQVRENHPPPATLPALLGLLQQEWLAIPQAFLRRYAMSVRRWCVDCMGSGGGYTTIDCFHELKWTCATFANFENVPIVTKVLINLEPEIKMSWNFVCMELNVKPNFG